MYNIVESHKISELSTVSELLSNDIFVVSTPAEEKSSSYSSNVLTLDEISKQLCTDLSNHFGLKSMAFEEKWNYAKNGHIHDYTKIQIESPYENLKADRSKTILKIDLNGTARYIKMPKVEFPTFPEPEIGELKFLANCGVKLSRHFSKNSDGVFSFTSTDRFDGWVYPDGSTFKSSDFPSASEIYGTSESTTFRVPDLRTFFKCNNGSLKNDSLKHNDYVISVPPHVHKVTSDGNELNNTEIEADVDVLTWATGDGKHPTVHRGDGPINGKGVRGIDVKIDTSKFNGSASSVEDPIDDDRNLIPQEEPYPTHDVIPVLIYIGRKNWYEDLED